jgi:hypothetical protein
MESKNEGRVPTPRERARPNWAHRRLRHARRHAATLPGPVRGLMWAAAAGLVFSHLNALMRLLTQQLDPFETQFLRYLFGVVVMLPLVLRGGLRSYWPKQLGGQFTRGAVHTLGLCLWFTALPEDPARRHDGDRLHRTDLHHGRRLHLLQGTDALGALARRRHRPDRRADRAGAEDDRQRRRLQPRDAVLGPVFAASFLLTKSLTRHESTGVIVVWQAISVTCSACRSRSVTGRTRRRSSGAASRSAGCSAAPATTA